MIGFLNWGSRGDTEGVELETGDKVVSDYGNSVKKGIKYAKVGVIIGLVAV